MRFAFFIKRHDLGALNEYFHVRTVLFNVLLAILFFAIHQDNNLGDLEPQLLHGLNGLDGGAAAGNRWYETSAGS